MNDFIDTVDINDEIGPHGLVIIKDKNGNILVRKHNMVVMTGKQMVFDKVFPDNIRNGSANNYSKYSLFKLYFGSSIDETVFTYSKVDKCSNGEYYSYNIDNFMTEGFENNHCYIKINIPGIICDSTKAQNLSCLSVTMAELDNNNEAINNTETLFSRIKFDPIPMVDGNELTLLYYIYF